MATSQKKKKSSSAVTHGKLKVKVTGKGNPKATVFYSFTAFESDVPLRGSHYDNAKRK